MRILSRSCLFRPRQIVGLRVSLDRAPIRDRCISRNFPEVTLPHKKAMR
jgi:hypothetical protein